MEKYNNKLKKGFTLVELVVVIAVIAILAAVSVGAYFGVTNSARDSRLLQEFKTVSTSLKMTNIKEATLTKDGLIIEDINLLDQELLRITGVDYYLTKDTNSFVLDSPVIQFIKVNPSLNENTYDYFRYFIPNDNTRYCEMNIVNDSSSLHDYTETPVVEDTITDDVILPTGIEPQARYDFDSTVTTGEYRGESLTENPDSNSFIDSTGKSQNLVFNNYSGIYYNGTAASDNGVLYMRTEGNQLSYFTFTVPSDITSVYIVYGAYNGTYHGKIEVNGVLLSESVNHLSSGFKTTKVTTNNNKTITVSTTESNKYACIDSISFYK